MKTILIIEDDKIIKGIIEFLLKKQGFNIVSAGDGMEGIEKIDSSNPDLIITDVMMPFKSGLEIIAYSKNRNPNVPIVIISSLGKEDNTVKTAFDLGVDDVLAKPFNPGQLAEIVTKLLN